MLCQKCTKPRNHCDYRALLELLGRFELPTSSLPTDCQPRECYCSALSGHFCCRGSWSLTLSCPLTPPAFFRVWVTVWVNTAWSSPSGISRPRLAGHSWLLISLHPPCLKEMLELPHEDIDAESMAVHICRAVTHPARNQPEAKGTKTTVSAHTIGP